MPEEVARVVALAWGAEAAPQRGPKRELSLERIVEAAIGIADAEGLQAVTMQRVAKTFGYTTMAMYRYVANKDDLHRLMVDAATRGAIAVDDEDWRLGLRQLCDYLLETYRRHPWVLDIPASSESLLMPAQVRVADTALRAMRTLPVSHEERLLLLMHLSTFVRGHAALLRELANSGGGVSEATRTLLREAVSAGGYPDLAPLIESGAYFGAPEDAPMTAEEAEQDFAAGLRIWLDGIASVHCGPDRDGEAPQTAEPKTPEAALAAVEHELEAAAALRKATQRRVRELEKREAELRKRREAAKEAVKSAARARKQSPQSG